MPASVALACKLTRRNKLNEEFSRRITTPVSWLHSDLKGLLNDKNQKWSIIALALVVFQTDALRPEYTNYDILNEIMKLENCDFDKDCLTATLNELERTYLKQKDGIFTFQVPVVKKVLLKFIFQKHPELINCCDEKIRKRRVCTNDSIPANIVGEYRKSFYIKQTQN